MTVSILTSQAPSNYGGYSQGQQRLKIRCVFGEDRQTWTPAGFFPGVGKLGVWGRKSSAGAQGWSLGGGLGAKPSEADDRL